MLQLNGSDITAVKSERRINHPSFHKGVGGRKDKLAIYIFVKEERISKNNL